LIADFRTPSAACCSLAANFSQETVLLRRLNRREECAREM
jgi:hypothetical protein